MSQMQKSNGGNPSKRKTGASIAAAESSAETTVTDDRAVRQRTDPAELPAAVARSTAEPAAAASSSSSSTPPSRVTSFLRLAVVERQLIMQGLDLCSLARLASTCKQMRGEALDKEAGKFLLMPDSMMPLGPAHDINGVHCAHDSPLF